MYNDRIFTKKQVFTCKTPQLPAGDLFQSPLFLSPIIERPSTRCTLLKQPKNENFVPWRQHDVESPRQENTRGTVQDSEASKFLLGARSRVQQIRGQKLVKEPAKGQTQDSSFEYKEAFQPVQLRRQCGEHCK